MGQYNPHRPTILGQEWAPVKEVPFQLDTETERGVTFVLDHAATVVSGAVYVEDDMPAGYNNNKGIMMAVYEAGTEHLTGPIQRVVIPPVSGFWRSLDSANPLFAGFDPSNATFAETITQPHDGSQAFFEEDGNIYVMFDTSAVSSTLSGKRILQVNLLYVMSGTQSGVPGPVPDIPVTHNIFVQTNNPDGSNTRTVWQGEPTIAIDSSNVPAINRIGLGNSMIFDMLSFCSATTIPGMGALFWPIRDTDMQRFDTGNSAQQRITVQFNQNDGCSGCASVSLPGNNYSYVALEVLYCEERRLLYGARGRYPCGPHLIAAGQNKIMLKPSDTFGVAGKTLQPGEYTVTVTMADMGDYQNNQGGNYSATALLQKYALDSHTGVVIDTRVVEGRTFTRETSDILPRITLHTASGVVTGVHDYDTLVAAPVYDTVDVAPDVVEASGGTNVPYPQVRFYARRFGDTNVALVLRQFTAPATQVSITVDEFDALPEIVDGWREVTLRFPDSTIPQFDNTGAPLTWEFVADGLEVNNQWEILVPYGVSASSGPFDSSGATYGGSAAWTLVGASSLNNDADATLIFSQDPPAVTGFSVEILEQSLEPVGSECAIDPSCIPTALYYNHLTWNAFDVLDLFLDRTEVSGWGTPPSGQEWSHSGGTLDDYFVVSGSAFMQIDVVNTLYSSTIEASAYNVEVRGRVRIPIVPTGASVTARVAGRFEDSSNYYDGQISIQTDSSVTAFITKRVGGTGTVVSPIITIDGVHTAGDAWNLALRCQADQLLFKAWKDGYPEPLAWQTVAVAVTADSITGTQAAAMFRAETGFSGGTFTVEWLDFSATSLDVTAFEIQRQDSVDDEWQTIMLSTGTAVNEFNDYEARVGVGSDYRIRTVNDLGFYGPWTATMSILHTWDTASEGTDGWIAESTETLARITDPVHDGTGALGISDAMGAGFDALRFNDGNGGTVRDISALGDTLSLWARVPSGAPGTGWQGRIEVQDAAFTFQFGPLVNLTPGEWTLLTYTPPAGLLAAARAIGVQIHANDVNATVQVAVDTMRQYTAYSELTAPGVVGDGPDGNSVMIFTSNEVQDGSSNLAYVMVWTGDVTEEYNFPEAGSVQLRELFRRDFPLAFRPLERGGERFTRDLMVQNAAVPTGLVRDGFKSLRDMAWDDLSYVCVRNELGDRWFATVLVPAGKVQRNRRLYIARVEIIEVTGTPSSVDPTEA